MPFQLPQSQIGRLLVIGVVAAAVALLATSGMSEARRRRLRKPPAATTLGSVSALSTQPPLPAGWPTTFQLGTASGAGGAAEMHAEAPYGFRYQYLAGGVNTGGGWSTWNTNGNFVTYYAQDSIANSITPVFTYYMIYQSAPGNTQGEVNGVYNNMQNVSTMTSYYNDLKLFF